MIVIINFNKMLKKLKSIAYSSRAGKMLNIFTLKISDVEIARKVKERRWQQFNSILWYCTFFNVLSWILNIVNWKFFGGTFVTILTSGGTFAL